MHTSHPVSGTYSLHINIYFMVQTLHKYEFNSCIISDISCYQALKLLLIFTRINKAALNV